MDALRKEGRGMGLLSARRLKSFRCVVIAVVVINFIFFLSLSWKTAPNVQDTTFLSRRHIRHRHQDGARRSENGVDIDDQFMIGVADGYNENQNNGIVRTASQLAEKHVARHESRIRKRTTPSLTPLGMVTSRDGGLKSACSYRTSVYLTNRHIKLNKSPFSDYVQGMTCLEEGNIAVFSNKFTKFNNVIVDASKVTNSRLGGEKVEDVWNQKESDEYFKLLPGYFRVPCSEKPYMRFSEVDHLRFWHGALTCYSANETSFKSLQTIYGTTLAIQRYEYVNLYHTMCDFYNAFVLMLIYGVQNSKMNILAVDAHPQGKLDSVWEKLFGNFIRAGRLSQPTLFPTLGWGFLGYFSPLNDHEREEVPYLDEFREFFLSRYNVSTEHVLDCQHPNAVLIWRRDYVAHPRNPTGQVVRKFANEEEMVEQVQKTLGAGANVGGLQLDALSMKEQLETIASCDILIGMHGAGLSHILFLPPTSGVIELKPQYSNPSLQHFNAMARWRNLPYSIWHNFESENEKESFKTYIPRHVMAQEVAAIYKQICKHSR